MLTFFKLKPKKTSSYSTKLTLLFQFIKRDIYGQYASSLAGLLWTVINPLSQLLVYSFLFTIIFKVRLSEVEVGTSNFIMFFISGFLLWTAFSEAIAKSSSIIIQHSNLITKVAFPVELLPLSTVVSSFLLTTSGWIVFLIWLAWTGYYSIFWFFIPLALLLFFMFTLGLAWIISAISVFIRDTQHLISLILTLWFYFSPILYPMSLVPKSMRWAIKLNPIFYFLEFMRNILFKERFCPSTFFIILSIALVTLTFGYYCFNKLKNSFGDVI